MSTIATVARRPVRRSGSAVIRWPTAVCAEARWLWGAVVMFVAVSAWWFSHDDRMPDWDSSVHMGWAIIARDQMLTGHIGAPWVVYTSYPPLQHVVGGIILLIAGLHPAALLIGANAVFVPLLAFGCYGTAKIAVGPRAGLLAGLVALGTPMFVSEMHMYEPDPEQAAMVAIAVWALLASDRLRRPQRSGLAGALVGLALLTKQTSLVFLAGPFIVILARGGWRRRANLARFTAWLAIVAGPWYAFHLQDLSGTFSSIAELHVDPVQAPPMLSSANAGWYLWDLLNQQVLAVVGVSFLIGLGFVARRRRVLWVAGDVSLELVAGALVSYIGMSLLTHKDPRYTLPALIYVVVLGTVWIARVERRRLRRLLAGTLVVNAMALFIGMSFGLGGPLRVGLHSSPTLIMPRSMTLYETTGWLRGGPAHDAAVLPLLRAMRARDLRSVAVDTGPDSIDFNFDGIRAYALMTGLRVTATANPTTGQDALLYVHRPRPGDPAPCQRLSDGDGIYLAVGDVTSMHAPQVRDLSPRVRLICPSGA